MIEDDDCFVVVLIGMISFAAVRIPTANALPSDEVESLTAARAGATSGVEPSDALRVNRLSKVVDSH